MEAQKVSAVKNEKVKKADEKINRAPLTSASAPEKANGKEQPKKEEVKLTPPAKAKKPTKAQAKEVIKPKAKSKPAKETKKAETKVAELSRYGHRVGCMAAKLDDMLWEGCTQAEAIKTLVKEFDRDEAKAKAKFSGHVGYLPVKRNVPVDKPKEEGGRYKATKANI